MLGKGEHKPSDVQASQRLWGLRATTRAISCRLRLRVGTTDKLRKSTCKDLQLHENHIPKCIRLKHSQRHRHSLAHCYPGLSGSIFNKFCNSFQRVREEKLVKYYTSDLELQFLRMITDLFSQLRQERMKGPDVLSWEHLPHLPEEFSD